MLAKKKQKELLEIISTLRQGNNFLMASDILVCRKKQQKITTLDFVNDQEQVCVEINKEIGSLLCLIQTGISSLERFLNNESI